MHWFFFETLWLAASLAHGRGVRQLQINILCTEFVFQFFLCLAARLAHGRGVWQLQNVHQKLVGGHARLQKKKPQKSVPLFI